MLSGCSGWSAERCAGTDWERLGEDDGDVGYTADRIDLYAERCARHGIAPDREAYALGYTGGRDDYCTVRGGVAAGRAGRSYQGICKAGFEEDFLRGHALGRRLRLIDQELEQLTSRLNHIALELRYNATLQNEARQYYLLEERRLNNQIDRAEAQIRALETRANELMAM